LSPRCTMCSGTPSMWIRGRRGMCGSVAEIEPGPFSLEHWGDLHQLIVTTVQVRTRARPSPLLCNRTKPRPNRIVLDVAHRREKVALVHDKRVEAFLPKMPTPTFAKIDPTRKASVSFANRTAQSVFSAWHHDQMNVVRHQAVCPYFAFTVLAVGSHQSAVLRVVLVAEERFLPTVSALCYMMGVSGRDDPRKPCHLCSPAIDSSTE
jgi:hypothetical protein